MEIQPARLSLGGMRQNRKSCLCVVIASSQVRPLAHDSFRTERGEGDLGLPISQFYAFTKRYRAGKSKPLVVEAIVDLDDPELIRCVTANQSSHQSIEQFDEARIVGSSGFDFCHHEGLMRQLERPGCVTGDTPSQQFAPRVARTSRFDVCDSASSLADIWKTLSGTCTTSFNIAGSAPESFGTFQAALPNGAPASAGRFRRECLPRPGGSRTRRFRGASQ